MDKRMIFFISANCLFAVIMLSCARIGAQVPQNTAQQNNPIVNDSISWLAEETVPEDYSTVSAHDVDSSAAEAARALKWSKVVEILEAKGSLSRLEVFLLSYAHLKLGHNKTARKGYSSLAEDSSSVFFEYILFDYAEALAGVDSSRKAIAILKGVKDPSLEERAAGRVYEYTKKRGDSAASLAALDELVKRFPKHFSQSRISIERAELALSSKDTAGAVSHYIAVIGDGTGSNVIKAASALERLGRLTGKNLFLAGKSAVNSKNYASGEDWLAKYIASGAKESLGEAHYLRARAISRRGRYNEAVTVYKKIIKEKLYNSAWAELGLGYCYRKLEHWDDAKEHIDLAIVQGVGSNAEAEALWEGVELAEDIGDYKAAADYASRLAKKYPSHDLGDNGSMWAGLSNFLIEDYEKAEAQFGEIPKRYTDATFLDTGKFWQGLSRFAAGDNSSREILQKVADSPVRGYYSYYAKELLSGNALPNPLTARSGQWMSFSEAIDKAGESLSELGNKEFMLTVEGKSAQRAEIFAALGLIERSKLEFNKWKNELPDKPSVKLALLAVAEQWGLTNTAYELGLALVRDLGGYATAPKSVIRLAYPVFFVDRIFETARKDSFDAALMFAVMRRESRFDPHAVSYAGAIGLFQIMPQTGENLANRLREGKDFSTNDLYDYRTSIRYGGHYLADLLREHGLAEYALAEYNAGPAPVKRWKKTPHKAHRAVFVEGIDFQQTRHYVKIVLGDYFAYKELWDGAFSNEDK